MGKASTHTRSLIRSLGFSRSADVDVEFILLELVPFILLFRGFTSNLCEKKASTRTEKTVTVPVSFPQVEGGVDKARWYLPLRCALPDPTKLFALSSTRV